MSRLTLTPGRVVHVYSGDGRKDLGLATFEAMATVRVLIILTPDKGPVCYSNSDDPERELPLPPGCPNPIERRDIETPRFKLASGETIYGCQCWWEPVQ